MSPRTAVLELAVQDVAGTRIASRVGATRVELCVALGATGGLTPSIGLVEAVVAAAVAEGSERTSAVEVHPLVRSRAGGFTYDEDELAVQRRDVRAVLRAGASGVVVGALDAAGGIDVPALRSLVEAAEGAPVTFHRAIDSLPDPLAAIDLLGELGVVRVLTSGGAPRSIDGVDRLRAMVDHAAGRVQIMAGGGVRPEDIPGLLGAGVHAIHLSAKTLVPGAAVVGGGSDAGYEATDVSLARQAAQALFSAGSSRS